MSNIKSKLFYIYSAEDIVKKRTDKKWSIRRAAYVCGVSCGSWVHYERKGVSNGAVAAKIKEVFG